MRQSRKEAKLEWFMREGLMPERREAMALDTGREEFGSELGSIGPSEGEANGRRHPPGGRG
ncbi:hypothetical protein [Cohnella panacarvi]|uniref:hypothetical protein n=1 Tax=Cohnella panacarvi TaxID=400776 RepID=UPI00047ED63D|nr:hypothetical protein [Cohnella panacarvi]